MLPPSYGQARSEINEVLEAVTQLFEFLKNRAGYLGPLRMPVIGTGYGRVAFRIDEVARELALQFIASCSDSRYVEKLTIAIHPGRNRKHPIDMEKMQAFLSERCSFPGIPQTVSAEEVERPPVRVVEEGNE